MSAADITDTFAGLTGAARRTAVRLVRARIAADRASRRILRNARAIVAAGRGVSS